MFVQSTTFLPCFIFIPSHNIINAYFIYAITYDRYQLYVLSISIVILLYMLFSLHGFFFLKFWKVLFKTQDNIPKSVFQNVKKKMF